MKLKNKLKKFKKLFHHFENLYESEEHELKESFDKDGKIIFLDKQTTPSWLVKELNHRFQSNKNKGSKSGGIPA